MDNKIYKPAPISGFPEWLPEERIVEQRWLDHIRRTFESYGFCSIETPSVEALEAITAKGEVDKEIYVLERLQKDADEKSEARLALHFDQTVPLARYTAQHFNDLVFPFKRYQMQRVWRGERPQMGRMREFTQCDIDVINVDHLPLSFDAELAAMMYEVLDGLGIGKVQMRISNRKILMGLLNECDLNEDRHVDVLRTVDKLEKIGEDAVKEILLNELDMRGVDVDSILALVKLKLPPKKISELSENCPSTNNLIDEGVRELTETINQLSHLPEGAVVADLSIVRGLDYYTGTVYETIQPDVPEFTGSACSGGRYDDLAGSFINKHLPGVGISIGFSRLFDVIRQTRPDLMKIGPKSPADILMVLPGEDRRADAAATARTLRTRGFKVEMYHAPQKLKKQLSYAEKKGIPYVWFPPFEEGAAHEVKEMATGTQTQADPKEWRKE